MCKKNIYILFVFVFAFLVSCSTSRQQLKDKDQYPKREFRGTWIQTVFQGEYKDMSPSQMKKDFIRKLDFLHDCGINAIIFQVRPEADAFYKSDLEPWSRFFTGKQGVPPEGEFDLMEFLIEESHKRNMEFHAWLNPYRAGFIGTTEFAESHIINKYPGRFVKYNNQILFDPGQPQNRRFICDVVRDIVSRYNVDAIHMDDYFYPYPVADEPFPDDRSFERYGKRKGFNEQTRNDWRRENVNTLIKELKETILKTKSWVRFGISPFGIYRNKRSTSDGSGSDTNGLQNYDDLYADILYWVNEGWIDYNIPQLYWEIGHTSADYITLAKWWNDNAKNMHLYIGQDVARTMSKKQLEKKMNYVRNLPYINGNCFWPANEILNNNGGIADELKQYYHRYPALIPAYTYMSDKLPSEVKNLRIEQNRDQIYLKWDAVHGNKDNASSNYFVVYGFGKKEKINLNNPANIVEITQENYILLPNTNSTRHFQYVITTVDRYHNESKGRKIKIKL